MTPIKRSRLARSSPFLQEEALAKNAAIPAVDQPQSAAAVSVAVAVDASSNKVQRTSVTVSSAGDTPPAPPPPEKVITAIAPPPIFQIGEGCFVNRNPRLPPTFLDVCNYCKSRISPCQDLYMNGGLEAYCSPECRDDFNKMMKAAGKQSLESEPSASNFN